LNHFTSYLLPLEPPTAPPLAAPAVRRPHPASLPAGAVPSPPPRLIASPPPRPGALNPEFSLTLAIGLSAGRHRGQRAPVSRGSARLCLGIRRRFTGRVSRCSYTASRTANPSPAACKVAAARQLRHTAGVFAGSLDGRDPLDMVVRRHLKAQHRRRSSEGPRQGILFPQRWISL
jgi:hypothetical protein